LSPLPGEPPAGSLALEEDRALLEIFLGGATNLLLSLVDDGGDSLAGDQFVSPYTGASGSGPLSAYTGQNVDAYTNLLLTGADANLSTAAASSGLLFNVALSETPPFDLSQVKAGNVSHTIGPDQGVIVVPGNSVMLDGHSGWDTQEVGGIPYLHTQASIDGATYDIYANDRRLGDSVVLVPVSDQPAATGSGTGIAGASSVPTTTTPAGVPSPAAASPPAASPVPASGAPAGSGTWIGDVLAGMAGLFSPSAVGPYMQPRAPEGLPPGLQAMGQLNAAGSQAGLRVHGMATKAGVVGIGAATAVGVGGVIAGAPLLEGVSDASLKIAVTFPRATNLALTTVDALSESAIPRVAIGVGGAGAATVLTREASSDLPTLAPEIQSSVTPATTTAVTTEAAALMKARDDAVATARNIVQQELDEGRTTLSWAAARFGTWLDVLAKNNVRQAVEEGRLPATFVTSPTVAINRGYQRAWIKAPDVWDTATGRAWDFMPASEASFFAHERSYVGQTASGRLDPIGTIINEILPLFHFGFFGGGGTGAH